MTADAPGTGLTIRGGPGGTRARLEDLERAGRRLRSAADVMAGVAVRVARIVADPALLLTAPFSPSTWAAVEGGLLRAAGPPAGAIAVAARLTALGTAATGAGAAYRAADAMVDGSLHAVDMAVGRAVGTFVTIPVIAAVLASPLPTVAGAVGSITLADLAGGPDAGAGDAVLAFLGGHTGLVEHVVDALPGALGGVVGVAVPVAVPGVLPGTPPGTLVPPDVPGAAGWVGRAGPRGGRLRESGEVRVVARREVAARPPAGLADVLGGVATLDPDRGAAPGTVRVVAVTGPGGRRSWIVQIPGTQNWAARADRNPFDLTGNVHVMAGEQTAGRRLVESALRSAGAGAGEPVLLVGHSQGGIVAAGLAADPSFRASFNVTHVVTAGSPVAAVRVPDSVAVLSLEHGEDVVPRLDGDRNPDRARWVTVTRSTTSPGASPSPEVAHDLGTYTRTAALVDADPDFGLAAWREGLRPFLAGPGVTASGVEVTGERVLPGAG